jgi:Protein of unknown function (DUF3106)
MNLFSHRQRPQPASARIGWLLAAAFAVLPCVASTQVAAQTRAPAPAAAANAPDWESLSPAQREALIDTLRERWNQQNPQQRARMLQHAERWQRMTPEQRRNAQNGMRRWETMTPEQRKKAREAFGHQGGAGRRQMPGDDAMRARLRTLSPEQREVVQARLRELTPEQRSALQEKLRAMTPEQRREWLRNERAARRGQQAPAPAQPTQPRQP